MDRQAFVLAGWILAVFAVVGVGLGLTGFVVVDLGTNALGGGAGSGGAVQGTVVVFFAGPLVAMVTGLIAGSILWNSVDAVVAGGLGAFVGFYLLVFLSVPLMVVVAGGGGGGGGSTAGPSIRLGQLLVPVAVMGFPTGIVGVISAVIGNEMQ